MSQPRLRLGVLAVSTALLGAAATASAPALPSQPASGTASASAPQPEGGQPVGGRPEGGRPEGGRPEGGRPEGGRPEGGQPEGGRPEGGQPEGGRPYIETSLFFGTAHPDGSPPVTERQFRNFVDEFVTPRFPDGLTVQEGAGQYRDRHGTIERERSYELIVFYPTGQAGPSSRKIEEIRSAYEKKFDQESVARVDDRTTVDF